MKPVATVSEVFDAIQRAKAGAPDFCTNFFPVQKKVQDWIDHDELGPVSSIRPSPRPAWYESKTLGGKPLTRIGSLQGMQRGRVHQ